MHFRRLRLMVISLWAVAVAALAQEPTPPPPAGEVHLPELRTELLARRDRDQAIRNEHFKAGATNPDPAVLERMRRIDEENTARMKEIVREHGWPGRALVGADGSQAAWLLVQHAAPKFQEEMLPLVKAAYLAGDLPGSNYALLLDRVLVHQGKPQIYGSQGMWKDGVLGLRPIEDEANVDRRRAEVGLGPLADYLKRLRSLYQPAAAGSANASTASSSPAARPPALLPLSEVRTTSGDYFYEVAMPGPPFSIVTTRDQQWAFVSLVGARNGKPLGVAVLRREQDRFRLERTIATPSVAQGLVLTHDGKMLVAAAPDAVLLLNVEQMIAGRGDPEITRFSYDANSGGVYVNVTADDGTLFVSDERARKITVVDLRRVRAEGFSPAAIVGRIPVGIAPIALTFSPDERWLYSTSQVAAPEWAWPATVRREAAPAGGPPMVPEGAVVVIDVNKAKRDPENAVIARVPAGGSPVRLAISPTGDRAYVTARNSNALLVFDPAKLVAGDSGARIATVPVGSAPVGVLVIDRGRRIIVTNSNRFSAAADSPSSLAIVDAARVGDGAAAVIGTPPAGAFPRELHLMADGETILLTNFRSQTVRVIAGRGLPIR